MNKIVGYVLILLLYLALAKSFSPSEFGISYIRNEESLSELIQGDPVSVILTDLHSTGFIIKTYFHKYRVVYDFRTVEEIIVRTSPAFNNKHRSHVGLSIFRRTEDGKESFNVLPPGSIFIGDKSLGRWVLINSGQKIWRFYRPYRNIPHFLGWGNWRPTYDFYQKAQLAMTHAKDHLGDQQVFGPNGSITKESFRGHFQRNRPKKIFLKDYLIDYFKRNFEIRREQNERYFR